MPSYYLPSSKSEFRKYSRLNSNTSWIDYKFDILIHYFKNDKVEVVSLRIYIALARALNLRIFIFLPEAGWLQSLESSPSTLLFVRSFPFSPLTSLSAVLSPFSSFSSLWCWLAFFSSKLTLGLWGLADGAASSWYRNVCL